MNLLSATAAGRMTGEPYLVKTRLRTDVHFSTGQNQHMKLDPKSTVLTLGYKF